MTENTGTRDVQEVTEESHKAAAERPIKSHSDDGLDRMPFVHRLCDALVSPVTCRSTGVTVGVTGQWGSGKSSILNLVQEEIEKAYPEAIVVRFDPWLVSGRDELIGQFFAELIGTLNAHPSLGAKAKRITQKIASYGAHVSPLGNLIAPGIGAMIGGGLKATEKLLQREESLTSLKGELYDQLADIGTPFIVLIDELDRVEDEEVHAIAQLVRSIVDFPNISYLLAYDTHRVSQALGKGDEDRGRAYLEKIVQFQIPLPVTFDDELGALIDVGLEKIACETFLPKDWKTSKAYEDLKPILIPGIIQTPRDVKRLIGVFHVLASMVGAEVDWFGVLGISALQVKAPDVVDRIRQNPDWVVEDPYDAHESMVTRHIDKMPHADRLKRVLPRTDGNMRQDAMHDALKKLLAFLFPFLDDSQTDRGELVGYDSICMRRPLLTTLRLGLLPGVVSKTEISEFFAGDSVQMEAELNAAVRENRFASLYDRLSPSYLEQVDVDHVQFWDAVSRFLTKPDREWMQEHSAMPGMVRNFVKLFEAGNAHNDDFRKHAKDIFYSLNDREDEELIPGLVRSHMWQYGLFGCRERGADAPILDKPEAEQIVKKLSAKYRQLHLNGDWVKGLWNLQPVYIMLSTQDWDEECRKHMDALISDNGGLEGLTLMFFGSYFTTDKSTIEQIVTYDEYIQRVKVRTDDVSENKPTPVVLSALRQALGEL